MEAQINAWSKRKAHPRLRWLGREVFHILLTFVIGVVIASAYNWLVTNKSVISTAERVCSIYGRDEQECKDGIDNILNESNNVIDNNININGVER